MASANFNPQKNGKNRPRKNPPLFARLPRRKTAAVLAASIVLTVAALFNQMSPKAPGNRDTARPAGGTSASGTAYRVAGVPDGDTVVLRASSGREIRVRLYGVDAPELHQSGGKAAAKFTGSLIRSRPVSLRIMDEDRYGRTVALVFLEDGRILNEELVKAGHAWVYRAHCHAEPMCSAWYEYEYLAQKGGRGLWRDASPVPPWRWREQNPRK